MESTGHEAEPTLRVAGGDEALDAALNKGLDAFNTRASGHEDQREFTVRVDDDAGLVAG